MNQRRFLSICFYVIKMGCCYGMSECEADLLLQEIETCMKDEMEREERTLMVNKETQLIAVRETHEEYKTILIRIFYKGNIFKVFYEE